MKRNGALVDRRFIHPVKAGQQQPLITSCRACPSTITLSHADLTRRLLRTLHHTRHLRSFCTLHQNFSVCTYFTHQPRLCLLPTSRLAFLPCSLKQICAPVSRKLTAQNPSKSKSKNREGKEEEREESRMSGEWRQCSMVYFLAKILLEEKSREGRGRLFV